jgi:mannose-1-phosphate guanylyltransferase
MKAMILAAGFGTRLQPYTLLRPKPLFPVLNTPLLLRTIERLHDAGFTEIAVNCHHLAPQIVEALEVVDLLQLFVEDIVLGTGGGLQNALDWFAGEPVLVTNGDIYHDLDFARIMEHHLLEKNLVTLVCHDLPRFNKVSLGQDGQILQFSPCEKADMLVAFTGVHVVDPRALSVVAPGFSSIIDCYSHLLKQGKAIKALMVEDCFWMDMGTPEDYLELHRILLQDAMASTLIHPSVNTDHIQIKDWVVVGKNAKLGNDCILERVVVWDGGVVSPGTHLKDVIVT